MLQFRILGPLEVQDEAGVVELGGLQQRSLLAFLLLRANVVVATDSLVDALWGERPPRSAVAALQNGISQLRKLLGADVVETRPPGYRLCIAAEQLDVVHFKQLMLHARAMGPEQRAEALAKALSLWRGEPLADLTFERFAQDEIRELCDLRLLAEYERITAEIACGRHADVVAEAERLVAANPLREDLRGQLMIALYRSGRQAEGLQHFHAIRKVLDDAHAQQPGPQLQQIYLQILRHDAAIAPPAERTRPREFHYREIERAMLSARLVPVLGPSAGEVVAAPAPGVAEHLARHFDCARERMESLPHVAQHIAITHGIGPLYDSLHGLYSADCTPRPLHRSLAGLAPLLRARELPCQLLLTSGFDRRLEQAFADQGEEVDIVSYVATGRDRGKFLHVAPGGSTRVIEEPNLEVGLISTERTMILKLHGGTDELSERVRDSYVVCEDDYIDYLAHSDAWALLPVGIAARLRRSHFLFMDYGLDEWSLRVFLRRLWCNERIPYRSWALDTPPRSAAAGHWRGFGVEVVDLPAEEAVEELRRRLAGVDSGEPAFA